MNKDTKAFLKQIYGVKNIKPAIPFAQRKLIEKSFAKDRRIDPNWNLKTRCEAMYLTLQQHQANGTNVQGSVFSEIMYSQTLAKILGLTQFYAGAQAEAFIESKLELKLLPANFVPRFVYSNITATQLLIEGGGPNDTDSKFINTETNLILSIEDKEPFSKTSETDLKDGAIFAYGEDGKLQFNSLLHKATLVQYGSMLQEAKDIDLIKLASQPNARGLHGVNWNDFSVQSVSNAVSTNYSLQKKADLVLTEDSSGYLALFPSQDLDHWGTATGEIRPAGRNSTTLKTPEDFQKALSEIGGYTENSITTITSDKVIPVHPRGGSKKQITRYKLRNRSQYFVKSSDVQITSGCLTFNLTHVKQLIPTISAKLNFKNLTREQIIKGYNL